MSYYYRETGLTDLQAEEQGLVTRDANGGPTKTLTMGATIARLAPQEVYEKFMLGELTAREAYAEATKGQPGGISMAVDAEPSSEMKSVSDCVNELAEGKSEGWLRDTAWGQDIRVPRGKTGNRGTGKRGEGINHLFYKRMLHGFSLEEASFIAACALKAAESVKAPEKRESSLLFKRFGIVAVVADNPGEKHKVLTGYILSTEGKNKAVDDVAAELANDFYALDDMRRNREVGAALRESVDLLEYIIKQNPTNWEEKITEIVEGLKNQQNARFEAERLSKDIADAQGGTTFALDLDNGLGAMQLAAGVSAKEEAFQKMLRSIEVAGRQWNAPFKGSHDSREKARGSTIGLAMGIYRKLPAGYRVKLERVLATLMG